jgi:hypothetical protein
MPSNPYSSGAAFPDMSDNILKLVQLKMGADQHAEDRIYRQKMLDMEGRRLQAEYGLPAGEAPPPTPVSTAPATLGVPGTAPTPQQFGGFKGAQLENERKARQIAEAAQKVEAEKFKAAHPRESTYDMPEFTRSISALKLRGIPVEDLPFIPEFQAMAADGSLKRGDIADATEMKWGEWSVKSQEALYEKAGKLSDQAAALPDTDPKKKELLAQIEKRIEAQKMVDQITKTGVKQTLFPDVYQYEQNTKAALAAERQTGQEAMLTDRLASAEKVNEARIAAAKETAELRARTSEEIAQARLDAAKGIADANRNKPTTETELRAQRKELADNESKLLLNKDKEGAGPLADLHNERSEKPYAYQWKKNSVLPGGEYVQIKLPKIKGKQVTAKDVYDTASQRGMTYDEVLQAIGVK